MINSSTSQIREQLELAMKEYMASIKDTDTVTTAEMRTYISQYLDTVKRAIKERKVLQVKPVRTERHLQEVLTIIRMKTLPKWSTRLRKESRPMVIYP